MRQTITDVMGANKIGMKTGLVKTREFCPSDLQSDVQPDFIADSIQDIPDILFFGF